MALCRTGDNSDRRQVITWNNYVKLDHDVTQSELSVAPGLTLIPAWVSNHIHYKLWYEITYPFLNFNGATVEV